jgi:peptide/nickel transport system permease protein
MIGYIINRLLQAAIVLIITSIIVFCMMRLLPGDPLQLFIVQNQIEQLTDEDMNKLRAEFGLDKPLPVQYVKWVESLAHGDFGESMFRNKKVSHLIIESFPVTIYLGILSIIISTVVGISAGLICALRQGSWLDTVLTSIANFGMSVPVFWLGVLMIYIFSLYLGWLPVQGYTSPFEDLPLSIRQLIMPVFCLATISIASIVRQTRSSMLEVVRQDYVRTAWSKGLTERIVVMRHITKNGLIPVITLVGIYFANIVGGSVLIETVFNIPGMGRLMVEAVFAHDYPIVQGGCLVIAALVIFANFAIDISYDWLDPRIRYG